MLIELLADIAKMTLFVACTYAAINVYVRRVHSDWTERLTKRRVAILAILTLAVGAIKVIEDVVAKESGPVDEMVLWFIRDQVPSSLTGFFELVTLSGSRSFLPGWSALVHREPDGHAHRRSCTRASCTPRG